MKGLYQRDPCSDENCPQDQGTKNAIEKDLMLVERGDAEVGKDQQKDENVINTQ